MSVHVLGALSGHFWRKDRKNGRQCGGSGYVECSGCGNGFLSYYQLVFHLQLSGMGMGKRLCFYKRKEAYKPWICDRAALYDLRLRRCGCLSDSQACIRKSAAAVSGRNCSSYDFGIPDSCAYGVYIPYELVGLQQK